MLLLSLMMMVVLVVLDMHGRETMEEVRGLVHGHRRRGQVIDAVRHAAPALLGKRGGRLVRQRRGAER